MASPWQGCPPQRGEQSRTPFGPADVRVRFVPVTTILSGTLSAAKIAVGRLAHTHLTCHIPYCRQARLSISIPCSSQTYWNHRSLRTYTIP